MGDSRRPLHLTIRFATTDLPDLPLIIYYPGSKTPLSLKCLIRSKLPEKYASNRLRLIHGGRVLPDDKPLSQLFKIHLPPPPRADASKPDAKGKGKAPAKDKDLEEEGTELSTIQRIYIHCSIGDVLSAAEIAAEAADAAAIEAALTAPKAQPSPTTAGDASSSSAAETAGQRRASASTSEAPRGFDRLLNAGFTATEVAQLRSQFVANLSFTQTPDEMPSGAALRELEDRWLDSGAQDGARAAEGAAAATQDVAENAGWGAGFSAEDGGLDDMLWGNVLGFFWPLASLIWGFREEGVWSRRRQIAVFTGLLLNLSFGFLRLAN